LRNGYYSEGAWWLSFRQLTSHGGTSIAREKSSRDEKAIP